MADNYAVASLYTEQVESMHDFFKPQAISTLFQKYGFGQYMPMFQIFRSLGKEEAIANDSWFGWEEEWYHREINVKTATSEGSAGASVQITLAADDHDSKGNSYPRVGGIVFVKDTYQQLHIVAKDVTTPSAHVLTLRPSKTTETVPAFAEGQVLIIASNAWGAGTDQPEGTVVGATKKTFYAQIFKETIGAEGSQLVKEKWFDRMEDGSNVKSWYSPGYMRGEYLMALAMDGQFTWGDETDNVTVASGEAGAGNANKTTKGLYRHASEGGKALDYTAGSFDPTDMDAVGLYYKSQGITSAYSFGWIGNEFNNDIENGLVSYLANTGVDYTNTVNNVFNGENDMAVGIGFDVLKKGSVVHMLKPMDAWSNPKTFGAEGYDMPKRGLFTPLSKFVDPKSQAKLSNIATRYRAMDGYSRRFEIWTVRGAGNGLKVISIDKTNTFFRAHLGLQAFKTNQFIHFDTE